VEVNIDITTGRFTANTIILHIFQSMVNGIDEYRPIIIGIIRSARFVNDHILY